MWYLVLAALVMLALVGLWTLRGRPFDARVRYLVLMRVPLVLGTFLLGVPYAAWDSPLLGGVFVLEEPIAFFLGLVGAAWVGGTDWFYWRLVDRFGPRRRSSANQEPGALLARVRRWPEWLRAGYLDPDGNPLRQHFAAAANVLLLAGVYVLVPVPLEAAPGGLRSGANPRLPALPRGDPQPHAFGPHLLLRPAARAASAARPGGDIPGCAGPRRAALLRAQAAPWRRRAESQAARCELSIDGPPGSRAGGGAGGASCRAGKG